MTEKGVKEMMHCHHFQMGSSKKWKNNLKEVVDYGKAMTSHFKWP